MKKQHFLFVTLLIAALGLPACAPAEVDCADAEVFCVGLVTATGKIDDQSVNQAAWKAVQQSEQDLGARIQYVESTAAADYAGNIAGFGEEGYDVIVTVGSEMTQATVAAAAAYPEVDFIGVDQFQEQTVAGVVGLNFPEDQAGFLVGALAAMMSKTGRIGAVCGTNAIPAIWRFGEGYRTGAAYADQFKGTVTEVVVHYHSNNDQAFTDPEWGAATAESLLEEGADMIFGCGGITGNAAVIASAQAGAYAIGAETDQYLSLPEAGPRLLSSALKLITPGVFELIKFSHEGRFPSGNYFGRVGYAPYHELEDEVPAAVKLLMEQIRAGLLDGSITTNVPAVGR